MSKKKPIGADYWLYKSMWRKGSIRFWRDLVKRPKHIVEHKIQRAQNGFSWADWINFDSYIGPLIAKATKKFADDGVGFFPVAGETIDNQPPDGTMDYPEGTYETFKQFCYDIHDDIMAYYNGDILDPAWTFEAEMAAHDVAVAAVKRWADHLGHWWD